MSEWGSVGSFCVGPRDVNDVKGLVQHYISVGSTEIARHGLWWFPSRAGEGQVRRLLGEVVQSPGFLALASDPM